MNADRTRILYQPARGLWVLTAVGFVLLYLLGFRPALSALSAPTAELASMWTVATAQAIAIETTLNPAIYAIFAVGLRGVLLAVWIGLGFLVVRQQRGQTFNWFYWLLAFLMVFFGALFAQDMMAFGAAVFAPDVFEVTSEFISSLGYLSLAIFLYLFPDGRFVPRWAVVGLVGWCLLWFVRDQIPFLIVGSFLLLGVASLIYRYWRVATPHQRQQIKWIVWGLVLFILTSMTVALINPLLSDIGLIVAIFIPVSIGMSMLRSRLWDIDIIIRRTLVYGALTLSLVLVYFGSVLVLQNLVQRLTGQGQSPLVIVVSTLLIAALFNPLRHRIQNDIDRRFYRSRYNAERTLETFAAELRQEVDLDQISRSLLAAAARTMQPKHASLWLKPEAGSRQRAPGKGNS